MTMPQIPPVPEPADARARTNARVSDEGKMDPVEANYVPTAPEGAGMCADCAHFLGVPERPDDGRCEVVAGVILPTGTSDLFEPMGGQEPSFGPTLEAMPPPPGGAPPF